MRSFPRSLARLGLAPAANFALPRRIMAGLLGAAALVCSTTVPFVARGRPAVYVEALAGGFCFAI